MKTRQWIALAVLAGGLIVALLSWNRREDVQAPATAGGEGRQPGPVVQPVPRGDGTEAGGPATSRMGGDTPGASPMDTLPLPTFKATPDGRLLVDAQARGDLERLTAVHGRDDGLQRLSEAAAGLPSAAQRDARDLYQQYQQYNQALGRALAPEQQEQPTLEEARRQLQTVRELRAQYFGERAKAMFGEEEAMQQQLLDAAAEAMKTKNLSQDEAVGYAQEKLAREQAARR